MENNRKVAIITDDSAQMGELAGKIAAIIGGYSGYSAVVIPVNSFSGADILPAHAFFLGCETPNPSSFGYLETLLRHINLAGRPCGIFSSNSKTVKYLSVLIRDSESAQNKPFLAKGGAPDGEQLQKWIQSILMDTRHPHRKK